MSRLHLARGVVCRVGGKGVGGRPVQDDVAQIVIFSIFIFFLLFFSFFYYYSIKIVVFCLVYYLDFRYKVITFAIVELFFIIVSYCNLPFVVICWPFIRIFGMVWVLYPLGFSFSFLRHCVQNFKFFDYGRH